MTRGEGQEPNLPQDPEVPEVSPEVEQANKYFEIHLEAETWSQAKPEQKAGALKTAKQEITSLPIHISPANEDRIQDAIYEQALFRLRVNTKRELLQAQGVTSANIAYGPQEQYGDLMFGVPLAPRAKLLLTGCYALGVIR